MLGDAAPPGAGGWDRALEVPEPSRPLGEVRPLFPKELSTTKTAAPPASGDPLAGPTPAPLDIRAATVLTVENHPSADRLYVVRLDDGGGPPRTVVAGLRGSYSPQGRLR